MIHTSAQNLAADIEMKNKRYIMLTLLLTMLAMQLLAFMAVRSLHSSTMKSLLESQSTPLAFQEWRAVRNGIIAGWIWWPRISRICLYYEGQEVLNEAECPTGSFWREVAGTIVSQRLNGTEIRASLGSSQWWLSAGLTLIALLPLGLFGFVLRIPIVRRTQAQLLESLSSTTAFPAKPIGELSDFQKMVRAETDELVRLKNEVSLATVATQVAHDIRSPLSALNMVLGTMKGELSEQKRIIIRSAIQRINDIANNLLSTRGVATVLDDREPQAEMLIPLIDSIVSEKRAEYRDQLKIEIHVDLSNGYGLFAKIKTVELSRVISNIINNSVEALAKQSGQVTVSVESKETFAAIVIEDTAAGIPAEILAKVGEKGFTFGKADGSGLGLFHARRTIEDMGGKFTISSKLNFGTRIEMTLPVVEAPSWFVRQLNISDITLVSIDDDQNIHQIWAERLRSLAGSKSPVHQVMFSSLEHFINWFHEHKNEKLFFLIDQEFLRDSKRGLDVIEQLGIANQSVLVTSRFDELGIRERANGLGVKILPKSLAPYIPLIESF